MRGVGLLEPEFEVVGAVEDGRALLKAESELQPDICIVDIAIPTICGIDAAAKLKASRSKAKIVVLTFGLTLMYTSIGAKPDCSSWTVVPLPSECRSRERETASESEPVISES